MKNKWLGVVVMGAMLLALVSMLDVDFTPPIAARLREAIASAYFALALIVVGMVFLAAAYLLWHQWDESTCHAH